MNNIVIVILNIIISILHQEKKLTFIFKIILEHLIIINIIFILPRNIGKF